jgi:protein-S-isoprenylcysteine O-methyltransferase Ste14
MLNAMLFFGIFMLALPALAHHLLPMALPFSPPLRTWVAGIIAALGIGAWIACLDTFSRYGRGTPLAADAPRHLVTKGLFRHTRNPIMAAELSVIWAEVLYLASLGALVYAIAITIAAHVLVVHIEEPELRKRFGQSYAEYCREVPRWLPRLRRQA